MSSTVNDVNICVATMNGSGSQSANSILMRSIFNMGVPVSSKNLFPSNIAGLPTWFTIRANKNGYIARRARVDVLIAMNQTTVDDDLRGMSPGAFCILNSGLSSTVERDDVTVYKVPFEELVKDIAPNAKLRKLLVNMIYVGVAGELLGLDDGTISPAVDNQFSGKPKAADLNKKCVAIGREYVRENPVPFKWSIDRMNATEGKIIIDGNAAAGLGAVFAGLSVLAWYPITPSSSVCESAIGYLKRFRHDEDGKANYAVVQAEDELASIGMVVGAMWAGARAMTATAGPGISLMAEFTGLSYFAEIPAVIWNVQRVGPSTGLPTRTAQADLTFTAHLSHGDTEHIVLLPGTVRECYDMAGDAFDLAEDFQAPVFVLSDLDLGMNNWMSDPFPYVDRPLSRGKVLSKEDLDRLGSFERYRDVDGDGIPYRTIPGNKHPRAAYFTRGSGHNEKAGYTEKPDDYVNLMDRLKRKMDTARGRVPQPITDLTDGAKVGIVAFGTSDAPMREARDALKAKGIETSYLRIRALPLNDVVKTFIDQHEQVFVVEQNRDGQMAQLLRLHCGDILHKTTSVLHYDGLPLDAQTIIDGVAEKTVGVNATAARAN